MCDQGKKSQVYLAAVARLKQIFEIKSPEFEPALLAVVRKHCQGGKSPTLKKGNRRCRQTYKDLSTRPMYKEVFGGIVKVFKIRDAPRFYKDVGDVLAAFCGLPESKIMKIKLEKMGIVPDMKGRIFKIEIDERFKDVHVYFLKDKIKMRVFIMQWHDLKPDEKFLEKFDKIWLYREPPPSYVRGKINELYIGDLKDSDEEYRVHLV